MTPTEVFSWTCAIVCVVVAATWTVCYVVDKVREMLGHDELEEAFSALTRKTFDDAYAEGQRKGHASTNLALGLTLLEATEIARAAAKARPEKYYAEPFEPHGWVVDAVRAGYQRALEDKEAAQ